MGYYNRSELENYIASAIGQLDSALAVASELKMWTLESALQKKFDDLCNLEDKLMEGRFDENR